jgi:hypothetical protein
MGQVVVVGCAEDFLMSREAAISSARVWRRTAVNPTA